MEDKMVKNFMEYVVKNSLEETLKRYDCCKCQQCKDDISNIALNVLPPKYTSTGKGEMLTKVQVMNKDLQVQVLTEVIKAIEVVSKNVRHEPKN
jgi:competence protein ComFB